MVSFEVRLGLGLEFTLTLLTLTLTPNTNPNINTSAKANLALKLTTRFQYFLGNLILDYQPFAHLCPVIRLRV